MASCRLWPGYDGIGSSRRVAVIFRHAGFDMIPRLRAPHEDVGLRPEPAWIVQRADSKTNQIRAGRNLHIERRAAIAAEDPDDLVAAVCLRGVSPGHALEDAEPRAGHARSGNMRRAALPLAVATMAAQGEDGGSHGFVADRTAQASAGSWLGHDRPPGGRAR